MGTAADALGQLRSWLGTAEAPPHSNLTWIGSAFGWNGVAWCAECQSLALDRSGTHGLWSASCWVMIQQLKAHGRWHGKLATPSPGMLAFYSSATYPNGGAHVNMIESVSGGYMVGLGGNESDAVRRSRRSIGSAYGFGTPLYSVAPAPVPGAPPLPPAPPPEEVDMPVTFVYKLAGRPECFVCDLITQRWIVDPDDLALARVQLASRKAPVPDKLSELSVAVAKKWPVTNLLANPALGGLGFKAVA